MSNSNNATAEKSYPPFVTAQQLIDNSIIFAVEAVRVVDFKFKTTPEPVKKWVLDIAYKHPKAPARPDFKATLTFFYFRKSGKVNTNLDQILTPYLNGTQPLPAGPAQIISDTRQWSGEDGELHTFTELLIDIQQPKAQTSPSGYTTREQSYLGSGKANKVDDLGNLEDPYEHPF